MSDFLLDTDVLIRCLRGIAETLELAQTLTEEGDLHVSVWSQFEVLTLAVTADEKKTLEFITPFIVHPINDVVAHRAAALVRESRNAARPLNFAESLIASTAIQFGLTVVTYNPQNLQPLPQVKLYPLPVTRLPRGLS